MKNSPGYFVEWTKQIQDSMYNSRLSFTYNKKIKKSVFTSISIRKLRKLYLKLITMFLPGCMCVFRGGGEGY